jgi:uncharacterized FlaG/YvyC family protein
MSEAEKEAGFAEFKQLEEMATEMIYTVLDISKSEANTRKFLDKCLKNAQQRYADEHVDEIMSGLQKGLDNYNQKLQTELDKKQQVIAALRKLGRK